MPGWGCDLGRAQGMGGFGLKEVPVSCLKLDECCFHSDEQGMVFITKPSLLGLKIVSLSFTTLESLLHSGQMVGLYLCLHPGQQAQPSTGKEGQIDE